MKATPLFLGACVIASIAGAVGGATTNTTPILNGGIGSGPGGLSAEIKYRYLRWKMNRLRKKFDVVEGGKKRQGPWVH